VDNRRVRYFNGNGKAEFFFHSVDGAAQIWFMDNNRIVSRANLVAENGGSLVIGPPWRIAGIGDFDGNRKADILYHNAIDGTAQLWFMDTNKIVSRANLVAEDGSSLAIGPPWTITGLTTIEDFSHWIPGSPR